MDDMLAVAETKMKGRSDELNWMTSEEDNLYQFPKKAKCFGLLPEGDVFGRGLLEAS